MTLLRKRQETFVERSLAALDEHKNTLGVSPTGSGKSVILSAVVDKWLAKNQGASAISLAHRDELISQNKLAFEKYVQNDLYRPTTSLYTADEKSWKGNVVFSMVQTLARESNLKHFPKMDLMVIDEAHHAAAPSYKRIIETARERNPDICIYGVTATSQRGDRKGLKHVFSNVADQITLSEMIKAGYLVPPKTYVIDLGVTEELKKVKKKADEFDMAEVEAILDHEVLNQEVVKHWKEKAGDRKTIAFCSTVNHAHHVCRAFQAAGVKAGVIHGDMSKTERRELIKAYDQGDLQVLLNCFVLTEGFDSQPTGCVILLRPSSHKSTFIQCVGRGLRIVDPKRYPGVVKTDCIVLDFGTSAMRHGSLEQEINLEGKEGLDQKQYKTCPECEASVPYGVEECPLCGFIWTKDASEHEEDKTALVDFTMTEIDLLNASRFRWIDPYDDGNTLMASGFNAWTGVFNYFGAWYAIGGLARQPLSLLAIGEKTVCMAACDDFLNNNETESGAIKSKNWLNLPVTEKQLKHLPGKYRNDFGLDRYKASCLLNLKFNYNAIKKTIVQASKLNKQAKPASFKVA